MYKIIQGGSVIELATAIKFLRYLPKSKRTVVSDQNGANCIQVLDSKNIYAIRGRKLPDSIPYPSVVYSAIQLDEYNRLKNILHTEGGSVGIDAVLNLARDNKVAELKQECSDEIRRGVCVTLSDGKKHIFELTIEDQLNLRSIESRLGYLSSVIYHDKGGVCRPFSSQDMTVIIDAANRHIEYHTTYFNLMKYCIYNMYDVEKINSIHYGDSLPDKNCRNILYQI